MNAIFKHSIFFITDQVECGNSKIMYCWTSNMTGDYMTKGLQGAKYNFFCDIFMGRWKLLDMIMKEDIES